MILIYTNNFFEFQYPDRGGKRRQLGSGCKIVQKSVCASATVLSVCLSVEQHKAKRHQISVSVTVICFCRMQQEQFGNLVKY